MCCWCLFQEKTHLSSSLKNTIQFLQVDSDGVGAQALMLPTPWMELLATPCTDWRGWMVLGLGVTSCFFFWEVNYLWAHPISQVGYVPVFVQRSAGFIVLYLGRQTYLATGMHAHPSTARIKTKQPKGLGGEQFHTQLIGGFCYQKIWEYSGWNHELVLHLFDISRLLLLFTWWISVCSRFYVFQLELHPPGNPCFRGHFSTKTMGPCDFARTGADSEGRTVESMLKSQRGARTLGQTNIGHKSFVQNNSARIICNVYPHTHIYKCNIDR